MATTMLIGQMLLCMLLCMVLVLALVLVLLLVVVVRGCPRCRGSVSVVAGAVVLGGRRRAVAGALVNGRGGAILRRLPASAAHRRWGRAGDRG